MNEMNKKFIMHVRIDNHKLTKLILKPEALIESAFKFMHRQHE
jgi:hypothetical protein